MLLFLPSAWLNEWLCTTVLVDSKICLLGFCRPALRRCVTQPSCIPSASCSAHQNSTGCSLVSLIRRFSPNLTLICSRGLSSLLLPLTPGFCLQTFGFFYTLVVFLHSSGLFFRALLVCECLCFPLCFLVSVSSGVCYFPWFWTSLLVCLLLQSISLCLTIRLLVLCFRLFLSFSCLIHYFLLSLIFVAQLICFFRFAGSCCSFFPWWCVGWYSAINDSVVVLQPFFFTPPCCFVFYTTTSTVY